MKLSETNKAICAFAFGSAICLLGFAHVLTDGFERLPWEDPYEKYIRKPDSVRNAEYVSKFRFDDYVKVSQGFFKGFEGWVVEDRCGTVHVRLNDDSVPVNYLRTYGGTFVRRNEMVRYLRSDDLEVASRPVLKGAEAISDQAKSLFEFVHKTPNAGLNSELIVVDGFEYRVTIQCVGKPEK